MNVVGWLLVAVFVADARVTLQQCVVTGNTGVFGGGIVVNETSSEVALVDCVIEANHASYPIFGVGGMAVNGGSVDLIGCTIRDNTSGGPGGSYRYIIPREADRYYGVTARVNF